MNPERLRAKLAPSVARAISVAVGAFLLGTVAGVQASLVDVTAPTTSWTVIRYGGSPSTDPIVDQQTGSAEGDIVGNLLHPSVYTMFGDANTPSLTDGTLAFNIRLGADASPAGFKTALFVGIDANSDGKLDLFVGINNSGSADKIGIYSPGAGLNISPNTTTIGSTPLVSYLEGAANYRWTAVNTTNDPSVGTATDLDGGGQVDYFLSFAIPFNDIVTQLAAAGINGVDQNSVFSYVVATSTQGNSLNQDLNGVGKNYDGSATWATLGALADPTSPVASVPEVNPSLAVAALAALIIGSRYYRSRRLASGRSQSRR